MRTTKEYELKVGDNKVTLPMDHVLLDVIVNEEKIVAIIEIDTEDREICDVPLLLTELGEEIRTSYLEPFCCLVFKGKVVTVWEVL